MGVGIPLPKVPDIHFILIMEHRDTEMFNINTKAVRNKVFYRNKENKRHDTSPQSLTDRILCGLC